MIAVKNTRRKTVITCSTCIENAVPVNSQRIILTSEPSKAILPYNAHKWEEPVPTSDVGTGDELLENIQECDPATDA